MITDTFSIDDLQDMSHDQRMFMPRPNLAGLAQALCRAHIIKPLGSELLASTTTTIAEPLVIKVMRHNMHLRFVLMIVA